MPDHHVKEQPAALTYVRKKWGVKKDSNRVAPCTFSCVAVDTRQVTSLWT